MIWDLHAGGYIDDAERDFMLELARSGKSLIPAGRGELTPVEMVSDLEKRQPSGCSGSSQPSRKPEAPSDS